MAEVKDVMNDDVVERVLLRAERWIEEGFVRLRACLLWR